MTKTNAEWTIELKADKAIILERREALILMAYITEFEQGLIVRAILNYERNKVKLVRIP